MPKAWLHPQKRRRANNYVRKGPTEWICYLALILDLSGGPVGTEESLGTCSPAFLKGFLPTAVCSLAMDASFSLVEKKWIQIQIWEGDIICGACGNYVCIPHQDRIQLLELAAGRAARTKAVMGIHGPLVCAVQSLSPACWYRNVQPAAMQQSSSLIARRDCFALLPARSHEHLSALSCIQGMLLTASLALR